ncbi:MAG: hypothetical protein KGV43_02475 [Arcobacter sp.]|nr:hypothetical protein [Arcobacter sp.]
MEDKNVVFNDFVKKASKRLSDKRKLKKARLYIPSLDDEIVIRGLSDEEITECFAIEDNIQADKYVAYISIIEPNLKEVAKELKENGEIKEYVDVVDIFDMKERTQIIQEVFNLCGVTGDKEVKVVEVLKN